MTITQIMAVLLVEVLLIVGACAQASPSAPPAPELKGFTVSDLKIPELGESSGRVDIGVTVTNTGEQEGTYTVVLKIDGIVAETQNVTLAGGASRHVTFTTDLISIGSHVVTVDQLTGKLMWLGPN